MKFILSVLKIVFGVVASLFLGIWMSEMIQAERFKGKFEKIETRMTAGQVIEILGKPEQITYSDDSISHSYWYSSGGLGKSTEPSVTFDSTNVVRNTIYGD
jgi:hypothetical protein